MRNLIIPAVLLLLLIPHVQAISGNWFISLKENSTRCVDIILPDDAGLTSEGLYDYNIFCYPSDSCYFWGSTVTDEVQTTSENNTVIVPVCFNSFSIPKGNCSEQLTIRLVSPFQSVDKSWTGGLCSSNFADFDSPSSVEPTASTRTVLSSTFDLFDASFRNTRLYVSPAESFSPVLLLQSHAESISLDVAFQGEFSLNPKQDTALLSKQAPEAEINLSAKAPSREGEYEIKATVSKSGCSESFCKKEATLSVIVSDREKEKLVSEGFTLSVFPEEINVRDSESVVIKYTVKNYGKRREFLPFLSVSPSSGYSSTFESAALDLDTGEEKTETFIFTPELVGELYELTLTLNPRGASPKRVKSYVSTNEMLTDAMRETEGITDPEKSESARSAIDDWYKNTYSNSEYGEELEEYGSLKEELSSYSSSTNLPQNNKTEPTNPPPYQPPINPQQNTPSDDSPWLLIGMALAVVGLIISIVYVKKQKKNPEEEQYYLERA